MKHIDEIFNHYYSDEYPAQVRVYLTRPDKLNSLDQILFRDKQTVEAIAEAENLIQTLKEYRQILFEKSQEIYSSGYHLQLSIKREYRYYLSSSKIHYYITVERIFDNKRIAPQVELSEVFEGKERHKAIRRFQELKKLHPGIATHKDIDKKQWER